MNSKENATSHENKYRILLIEDHPVFRKGLKALIEEEENLIVCGEADSIATALSQIKKLSPDLAVVDIALKGRSGLDLIPEIKSMNPNLLVLVVSMFDETAYVQRALQAGARGYIVKNESTETVVDAIQALLRGEMAVSEPHHTRILESQFHSPGSDPLDNPQAILTNRELEIYQMIGRGKATREIANNLNLSIKTIGTYRERLKDKLGLKHAAALAKHAVQYVEKQSFSG